MNYKNNEEFTWADFFRSIWYFLEGYRKQFIFWTTTLLLVSFYQVIPPLIIGKIVDFFTKYSTGNSLSSFYFYVTLLVISYALASIIRLTGKNKLSELQAELSYTVKVKGFENLVNFSLEWHDKENTGSKIQRIQNGLASFLDFQWIMSRTGFETITAIIGIIFIFIFLNPVFVLFLSLYLTVFFVINASFYKKALDMQNNFNTAKEKASGNYFDGLSNILTIKTLGTKDSFKETIYASEQNAKSIGYKTVQLGIYKWKLLQIFSALSIGVYLLIVGNSFLTGIISIGSVFVFYIYLMQLINAAGSGTDLIERMIEIKSSISRMMPIYWNKSIVHKGTKDFPKNWGKITISDASFSYKNSDSDKEKVKKFHIDNINFSFEKYQKIGIAGRTGSGKSTFAKILLGQYIFEKGIFQVDKTDYQSIRYGEITKNITLVLQETEMFNLTLEENITLMKKKDLSLLKKAIEIAQLTLLVEKIPDGIATIIGEKGYRLSGGERQRIGIARAIYKNPQILILDEATSSLDRKTEKNILDSLQRNLSEKTFIIISHRLSNLQGTDKVYVFEKGTIVEQGKYVDLVKDTSSKFFDIFQAENKNS
ncbi:hypothetical protein COU88_00395 [Candidatus Roizmanbacteria bacterium CG10_big_fil_rev_8_21_14_0_10_39_6]|uniref:ABC transporter ATP-binding protein n=1 Tax=Candidatus Roizmanbacteria bacterium CG10_big_fil_rev_8_21_14_0_10_39_6 TaxID=1974853 RepID=A0A2M8KTR3_9BACT|nr:MAG: hypothetical protein COU88_00395 [Candidatus Roizmanbacteria bacterium CG10_big_fil_rev_8_21_14_0_10_39_6]